MGLLHYERMEDGVRYTHKWQRNTKFEEKMMFGKVLSTRGISALEYICPIGASANQGE